MKIKRKRCKECNELFTPKYSSLQKACSPKCAYAYSKNKDKKIKEDNDKSLLKLENERKERNGLSSLIKSTVNACHEYIRFRDKGKPCISCDTPWHKDFHAGHFYKAELYSSLRLDENNINGQCVRCNIREEGNLNGYALNLPKRIGETKFKVLKVKAGLDKTLNFKWDRDELKRIRKYYKDKLKSLKNENTN